ncbi:rutC family protein C23G10.2, partial [Diaphorina citri]|uniref:RutC family protein C23G10.2 n=1 Tax=Diaphorina citri TaxID=121845 RepID=A0A1S4EM73_DIACI
LSPLFSQAVQHDNTLYISGVLGIDASSGKMAEGVENQAKQALTNMGHILKEAGGSYEHVVKTTILLNDINDFATVNNVYGQFFKPPYPARSTFQVGKLPLVSY